MLLEGLTSFGGSGNYYSMHVGKISVGIRSYILQI